MANPTIVMFQIEVAYALSDVQIIKKIDVSEGCTVKDALVFSEILNQFPEIDLATSKLGIFGKFVPLSALVQSNDRIEIYRPLIIDPKDARRQRAKIKNTRL